MKVKIIVKDTDNVRVFIDDLDISKLTTNVVCRFPAQEKPIITLTLLPEEIEIEGEVLTEFRHKILEE